MGQIAEEIKSKTRISKVVVSSSRVHPNKASDFVSFATQELTPESEDGWTVAEAKLAHAILSRECEAARMRDALVRQNMTRTAFQESKVLKDYDLIIEELEKKVAEERGVQERPAPVGKVATA